MSESKLPDLLPCPFCGEQPSMEPWHGGSPQKRIVFCNGLRCRVQPQVTGSTAQRTAKAWNTRDGKAP